ncbi:odorant receptor 131-2-like [Denticeps clupeoides]|uniref:odorant receptor 131-2-like n=1 Tax=Denticeps clupeoides TaxID=299321 RepID=UPI0010A2E2B5|nr:odorant receptor 131-2-like [Denticeps clupeoides]
MYENSSQSVSTSSQKLLKTDNLVRLNVTTALVQVLVWPFIYINIFMFYVFLKKHTLRAEPRYVLFAQNLIGDAAFLLMTNFVVVMMHVNLLLPISVCIPYVLVMGMVTQVSPNVIVTMCLERYVAICMPLRHVSIFSPSRTQIVVAMVWIFSFLKPLIDLIIFLTMVSRSYFSQLNFCYYEILYLQSWQRELRSHLAIANIAVITLMLIYIYGSIITVARRASEKNKQTASKAQRTLLLHAVQLLLCTLKAFTPYVEAQIISVNVDLYLVVRYFNFLTFDILTRSLSPMIYGFRDEKFCSAVKYYARCRATPIVSSK